MPLSNCGAIGGLTILGGLFWFIIFIDLVLVGVLLLKQILTKP